MFKTVSDLTLNVIEQMKREDYDFYIILDLGGGMSRGFVRLLIRGGL